MKNYQTSDIRNVAVVGHASSGKTMLTECMALCGGVINRLGSIANGSTLSDYRDEEHTRQTSVQTSLVHFDWQGRKLNILDAPGYLDFVGESMSAVRVADLAVVVVHANHGIGVGTSKAWEFASQFNVPRCIVINALDRENVDFDAVCAALRERFGAGVVPITAPVKAGPGFNQVLDALTKEVLTYKTDSSGAFTSAAADGDLKARVEALHTALLEKVAESDDKLLEKFFEQGGLSEEEMQAGLRTALARQTIIPVFCTSAETNIGVNRLLDFIARFGPSPADKPKIKVTTHNGEMEVALTDPEPSLFVFKTGVEPQFGELAFFKVYSGTVGVGADLYNPDKQVGERIGQIFLLNGKNRTPVDTIVAGDIGAVVKLKETHANHTLCPPKKVFTFPKIVYPKPNIHAALLLKSKGDEDKVAQGLAALHNEDPTFLYTVDAELHQTVMSAQGELHLEVMAGRLRSRYKLDLELTQPRIPYRETIKTKAESKYRHKKQTGGAGQFAEVWMRIAPKERDTGVEFIESLVGQNVDRVFVPSVEKGVRRACAEGILAGYKVVDVLVDFYDGKMHPVDSKDIAFQTAGYYAFKEAFMAAKPCLLEPINSVTIHIPEDCMGNVMGDLSSRRGKILGMDSEGGFQVIKALVPAREMYRYSSTLRSLTGGRGIHFEEFSHYEEMPRELEQQVIEESKKRKAEQEKEQA